MATMAFQQQSQGGQAGGAIQPLDLLLKHMDTVPNMIYGFIVIVAISFSDKIPPSFSTFADSALGRLIGVGIVVAVTHFLGWSYGLLTAVAFLLVLRASPRLSNQDADGFKDMDTRKIQGSRWFVERVLGEKPKGLINQDVTTQAIKG
uniref:Uncharacterized protein n=1 Tax=viral metagenome TaxID=1070528 RepID=A0A6C0DGQ2_9ZZZZ